MRTIAAALQTHIELEVTTLALCWKVTRRDAVVEGWTDHDEDITYDGVVYHPLGAGKPSNYRQTHTLSPSNMDLEMPYGPLDTIDELLRAGIYDSAWVHTFNINWADTTMGIVKLALGKLGQVEMKDNQAKVELRSLTQLLSTNIGRIYTPECDATLGDARCKVVMTSYTKTGTVGTVTSNRVFVISGAAAGQIDNYYNYGKIVFSSGLNSGLTMQIEDYAVTTNVVTLFEAMPFAVVAGNTFTAYAGCDRRWESCKTRFSNKDSFRGQPHTPGMDKALTVPANQKWTED